MKSSGWEKKRQNWIFGLLCGILIGGGAILPGISGGVLCVVFGLYRPLMEILTHPRQGLKRYWSLFLPVVIGWPIGFFLLAKVLALLFGASQTVSNWLFIGLIVGTFPALYREAGKEGRTTGDYAVMILSFLLLFAGLFYINRVAHYQVQPHFGWFLFCGCLFGMSLVIPGLTSASILMSLGLYQPLMEGAAGLDAAILLGVLPGMVITVALLARLMNYCFRTHYGLAYHAVLGVVISSTAVLVPTQYSSAGEIALCVLCCGVGFAVAFLMEWMEKRGVAK